MTARNLARRPLVALVVFATLLLMSLPALAGGRPLTAELSADNEAPPVLVESDATGSAHVTLNQGQGEVCFEIEASGFTSDILFAHIHIAPAGVPGPVVVTLFDPGVPGPGDFGPGETLPADTEFFADCIEGVDEDLIKAIRQNPDGYYVNIHTLNNPGGEIRGQLTK
jgi:hypothetical protein